MQDNHSQHNYSNIPDNQLQLLSIQLQQAIRQSKDLVGTCKIGNYQQAQFQTTSQGELILPEYKEYINYNEEFWKKYLKNEINFAIIKDLSQKVANLQKQIVKVHELSEEYHKLYKIKNKKKNRRLAVQISKNFECPYENCYRNYGSDVSLNLHIKLKHGGGNKTDRQKLAEQIIKAQSKGLPMPKMRFNLPKGFLESFKRQLMARNNRSKQEVNEDNKQDDE